MLDSEIAEARDLAYSAAGGERTVRCTTQREYRLRDHFHEQMLGHPFEAPETSTPSVHPLLWGTFEFDPVFRTWILQTPYFRRVITERYLNFLHDAVPADRWLNFILCDCRA